MLANIILNNIELYHFPNGFGIMLNKHIPTSVFNVNTEIKNMVNEVKERKMEFPILNINFVNEEWLINLEDINVNTNRDTVKRILTEIENI